MAFVAMADAVSGAVASSSEYNKLIDNIEDVNTRTVTLEGAGVGVSYVRAAVRGASPPIVGSVGYVNTTFMTVALCTALTPAANTIYIVKCHLIYSTGTLAAGDLFFAQIFDGTSEIRNHRIEGLVNSDPGLNDREFSYAFNSGGSPSARTYSLRVARWTGDGVLNTVNGSSITVERIAAVSTNFVVHT